MAKPLPDIWTTRDLPVLVEVTRRIDAGEQLPTVEAVAETLGMTRDETQLAAQALERRGLIATSGSFGRAVTNFNAIAGQAYLLTGLHPDGDTAIDRLADAIRQAMDQTNDPEEKRSLRRFKDSLIDVPANLASAILMAFATGGIAG